MDIVDLPLVGGHPALDLVNTKERGVPAPNREPHDSLVDPHALLVWARRAGLVDDAEAELVAHQWAGDSRSAEAALKAVRELREALHVAVLAATDLAQIDAATQRSALDHLHTCWAAAVDRARLMIVAGGQPSVRLLVGTVPALLLPDRAADAAMDILRTDALARVRRCPTDSGGCGWIFLDQSRNRSRRWCRMADCGTHVKASRLTERRRAARACERNQA